MWIDVWEITHSFRAMLAPPFNLNEDEQRTGSTSLFKFVFAADSATKRFAEPSDLITHTH